MNFRRKSVWGLIIFTIVILIFSLASAIFTNDYELLFSNLTKEEESIILSKLESYGIKKEFKDGLIMVEKGERDNILMRLSTDKALPGNIEWGFLANIKKGDPSTDSEKNKHLKNKLAIEKELSRMIENSEKISSANVLLSNRKETLGESIQIIENEKRTAIITLNLKNGFELTKEEAEGIAELVQMGTAIPIENIKLIVRNQTTTFKK
jgi:flagellar biosynthesis/type III secretory pathway M-ring protein FliF/YscJ